MEVTPNLDGLAIVHKQSFQKECFPFFLEKALSFMARSLCLPDLLSKILSSDKGIVAFTHRVEPTWFKNSFTERSSALCLLDRFIVNLERDEAVVTFTTCGADSFYHSLIMKGFTKRKLLSYYIALLRLYCLFYFRKINPSSLTRSRPFLGEHSFQSKALHPPILLSTTTNTHANILPTTPATTYKISTMFASWIKKPGIALLMSWIAIIAMFVPWFDIFAPVSAIVEPMFAWFAPLLVGFLNELPALFWTISFAIPFIFRYFRVVLNIVANAFYRSKRIPDTPSYKPSDVSAVICTTNLDEKILLEVVETVLWHDINSLVVATAGEKALGQMDAFKAKFNDSRLTVTWQKDAGRRKQTAKAMREVVRPKGTKLVIICDDHTYWPQKKTFIPSLIAPFEDTKIGGVGPVIQVVQRGHDWFSWDAFWNHIGMCYLQRRAHEFLATNSIDGGLSCLSSRFAVFRSSIYAGEEFLNEYLNEQMAWPKFTMKDGLTWNTVHNLASGDDKFHTNYLCNNGWMIKIQGGDSTMMTELGHNFEEYYGRCIRWNRSTFQHNPRALFTQRTSWFRFPYTTVSVLVYSFFRFPAIYETFLMLTYWMMLRENGYNVAFFQAIRQMFLWIIAMKFCKAAPIFFKHPWDIVYFPAYFAFTWYMTLVKTRAVLSGDDDTWKADTKKVKVERQDSPAKVV